MNLFHVVVLSGFAAKRDIGYALEALNDGFKWLINNLIHKTFLLENSLCQEVREHVGGDDGARGWRWICSSYLLWWLW